MRKDLLFMWKMKKTTNVKEYAYLRQHRQYKCGGTNKTKPITMKFSSLLLFHSNLLAHGNLTHIQIYIPNQLFLSLHLLSWFLSYWSSLRNNIIMYWNLERNLSEWSYMNILIYEFICSFWNSNNIKTDKNNYFSWDLLWFNFFHIILCCNKLTFYQYSTFLFALHSNRITFSSFS